LGEGGAVKYSIFGVIIAMGILASSLSACSSSPAPRLYILEPIAAPAAHPQDAALSIAIGEVIMPAYLNRKEIVTRDERYEINSAKFDRWAEPLDQNIANILAENLSILLPSDQVVAYPWDPIREFDYTVRVRVVRFGASPNGNVELSAAWSIIRSDDTPVTIRRTQYFVDRSGDDVRGLVAAMSNGIEELSRDISKALLTNAR
jgi:uncharacterized protein